MLRRVVQAAKLAGQLKVPEGALWVVSPLTRAVQTFYLARRRHEPPPSRDHYLSTAVSLPAKVAPWSRLDPIACTARPCCAACGQLTHGLPSGISLPAKVLLCFSLAVRAWWKSFCVAHLG